MRITAYILLISLCWISLALSQGWDRTTVYDDLPGPIQVVAADFRGGTGPDVVTTAWGHANAECGKVVLAYNYSNGGWTEVVVDAGMDHAAGLAFGDIDGINGKLDFVASNLTPTGSIKWYTYVSDMLSTNTIASNLNQPLGLAVEDVDGDDDGDVFAAIYGEGEVVMYRNDDASQNDWETLVIDDDLPYPYAVALGHLDLDAYIDLVVTTTHLGVWDSEGVYIYHGTASGNPPFESTPETVYEQIDPATLKSPRSVRIGKLNPQDNFNDLLISFAGESGPAIRSTFGFVAFLAYEDGGNILWNEFPISSNDARDTWLTDFYGTTALDFAATTLRGHQVQMFVSIPNWPYVNGPFTIGNCPLGKGIAVEDITASSKKDIVAACYGEGQCTYMYSYMMMLIRLEQ